MCEIPTIGSTDLIVILGGSGTIGSEVARLAVAYGSKVISYTRAGLAPTDEPWTRGVEWRACDVSVSDGWKESLSGATALVNSVSTRGGWVDRIRSICSEGDTRLIEIGCASTTMDSVPDLAAGVHLRVPRFDPRAETGEVPPSAAGVAVGHAAMAALRAALEEDHSGVMEAEEVAYLGDAMFIQ